MKTCPDKKTDSPMTPGRAPHWDVLGAWDVLEGMARVNLDQAESTRDT